MDAHRVDILHVTDGDRSIVGIPHHLVLDLLIALHTLLYQYLVYRRQSQSILHDLPALFLVLRETAAGSAQGESRPQHDRVTDLLRCLHAFLHALGNDGGKNRLSQFHAQFLEQFSVLGTLDTFDLRAEKLHAALPQNTLPLQLHGEIQSGLPADTGKNRIGTLHTDDLRDKFQGQRFHIYLVRDGLIRHNGGRIGVAQDDLIALLA